MAKSMTGYGQNKYKNENREINIRIKSVNHRYRDISVKIPKKYSFAEEAIQRSIKERVSRGKVEASFGIENVGEGEAAVKLDIILAKQYYDSLRELQKKFDVTGEISLELLANMYDVIKTGGEVEDEEATTSDILLALKGALDDFDKMRDTEGKEMAQDIKTRSALIGEALLKIEKAAPQVAKNHEKKLHDRINELLEGNIEIAKDRIAVEAAIFADKANIDEEIVRLKSHISQLDKIISSGNGEKGRKLDFLIQEMNRETNTIASKANELDITAQTLEIKSELEKIREQVQNIE